MSLSALPSHLPRPAAGPSASARAPAEAGTTTAWLREMERQQAAQWFMPFAGGAAAPGPMAGDRTSRPQPLQPAARTPVTSRPGTGSRPMAAATELASAVYAQAGQPARAAAKLAHSAPPETEAASRGAAAAGLAADAPVQNTDVATGCTPGLPASHAAPAAGVQRGTPGAPVSPRAEAAGTVPAEPLAQTPGAGRAAPSLAGPPLALTPQPLTPALPDVAPQRPAGDLPATPDTQHHSGPSPRAAAPMSALATQTAARAEAAATQALQRVWGQHPQVRVHAQWLDDGRSLHLWLGMDGSARQVAGQLAVLVPELQRHLFAQGLRLARLVCNGQAVLDAAQGLAPAATPRFADRFAHLTAGMRAAADSSPRSASQEHP